MAILKNIFWKHYVAQQAWEIIIVVYNGISLIYMIIFVDLDGIIFDTNAGCNVCASCPMRYGSA